MNGSGDLHGYDFTCTSAEIEIDGSAKAAINATENLDANISGSGSISYKGSPHVQSEIKGSGTVQKGR
jgi:hypothetical protein